MGVAGNGAAAAAAAGSAAVAAAHCFEATHACQGAGATAAAPSCLHSVTCMGMHCSRRCWNARALMCGYSGCRANSSALTNTLLQPVPQLLLLYPADVLQLLLLECRTCICPLRVFIFMRLLWLRDAGVCLAQRVEQRPAQNQIPVQPAKPVSSIPHPSVPCNACSRRTWATPVESCIAQTLAAWAKHLVYAHAYEAWGAVAALPPPQGLH